MNSCAFFLAPQRGPQIQCWEEVAGVREYTREGPSPPRESHCLHQSLSEHHSLHPLSPLAPHATSFPSSLFLTISLQIALPPMSLPNKPYISDLSSPTLTCRLELFLFSPSCPGFDVHQCQGLPVMFVFYYFLIRQTFYLAS